MLQAKVTYILIFLRCFTLPISTCVLKIYLNKICHCEVFFKFRHNIIHLQQ